MNQLRNVAATLMVSSFAFVCGDTCRTIAHEGHEHRSGEERHFVNAAAGNPAGTFRNEVEIRTSGGMRTIKSNGLPAHATGEFPGRRNPNRISAQAYLFRVTLDPQPARNPTKLKLGKFGVALNGIPIDPGAAEFWRRDFSSNWQYAVINGRIDLGLDMNQAHVQPGGEYHYHGRPIDLIKRLQEESRKSGKSMTLIGYAADGYPIYDCETIDHNGNSKTLRGSFELKDGTRPGGNVGPGGKYDGTFLADWEYVAGSGDLDEFNGAEGPTPEYPDGTYYYVLTNDFPYVPRMFRGTPDATFMQRGPDGRQGRGRQERGPQEHGGQERHQQGFGPPPGRGGPGFGPPPRRR